MSAMGQYVYEMEEDAREMTLEAFMLKHGKNNADIWEGIHQDILDITYGDKYSPEDDEDVESD
tara:strand:- start:3093 stop:3281 length:189 start_codon:yes stop_codon:yes gene_type:complete